MTAHAQLSAKDMIKGLIKRLLKFPNPTICRHLVAASLLDILERGGTGVSEELAKAVVGADDELALLLLEKL